MESAERLVLDFPVYGLALLSDNAIVCAGGGGRMKSGIPNGIRILEFNERDGCFVRKASIATNDAPVAIAACPKSRTVYSLIGPGCKNYIYDGSTLSEESAFAHDVRLGTKSELSRVCLSENASVLALGSESGAVQTLSLPYCEPLAKFELHRQSISDLDMNGDGSITVSISAQDRSAFIWDTRSGVVLQKLEPTQTKSLKTHLRAAKFSPANSSVLYTVESNPRSGAWVAVWLQASEIDATVVPPTSVGTDCTSELDSFSTSHIFASYHPVACSKAMLDAVTAMAVDKERNIAISSAEGHVALFRWQGRSRIVKLWSSETRVEWFRPPPPPHVLPVTAIEFSAKGKYFFTASADFTVATWPARRTGVLRYFLKLLLQLSAVIVLLIALGCAEDREIPKFITIHRAKLDPHLSRARSYMRPHLVRNSAMAYKQLEKSRALVATMSRKGMIQLAPYAEEWKLRIRPHVRKFERLLSEFAPISGHVARLGHLVSVQVQSGTSSLRELLSSLRSSWLLKMTEEPVRQVPSKRGHVPEAILAKTEINARELASPSSALAGATPESKIVPQERNDYETQLSEDHEASIPSESVTDFDYYATSQSTREVSTSALAVSSSGSRTGEKEPESVQLDMSMHSSETVQRQCKREIFNSLLHGSTLRSSENSATVLKNERPDRNFDTLSEANGISEEFAKSDYVDEKHSEMDHIRLLSSKHKCRNQSDGKSMTLTVSEATCPMPKPLVSESERWMKMADERQHDTVNVKRDCQGGICKNINNEAVKRETAAHGKTNFAHSVNVEVDKFSVIPAPERRKHVESVEICKPWREVFANGISLNTDSSDSELEKSVNIGSETPVDIPVSVIDKVSGPSIDTGIWCKCYEQKNDESARREQWIQLFGIGGAAVSAEISVSATNENGLDGRDMKRAMFSEPMLPLIENGIDDGRKDADARLDRSETFTPSKFFKYAVQCGALPLVCPAPNLLTVEQMFETTSKLAKPSDASAEASEYFLNESVSAKPSDVSIVPWAYSPTGHECAKNRVLSACKGILKNHRRYVNVCIPEWKEDILATCCSGQQPITYSWIKIPGPMRKLFECRGRLDGITTRIDWVPCWLKALLA